MGGSRDPLSGDPANGVWLHSSCHSKIEMNRKWAVEEGWLVLQGIDPREVPVNTWYGRVLLGNEVADVDGVSGVNLVQGVSDVVVSGVGADQSDDVPTGQS